MSKRKTELTRRLRELDYGAALKFCERCEKPIAYLSAKWKYKYCPKCTLKAVEAYHKREVRNSQLVKYTERAYTSGRQWLRDKCEICGFSETLDVHRVIPQVEGGKYTLENTVTLCPNHHALITRKKKKLKVEFVNNERVVVLEDIGGCK